MTARLLHRELRVRRGKWVSGFAQAAEMIESVSPIAHKDRARPT
jgi:hypothetical protein